MRQLPSSQGGSITTRTAVPSGRPPWESPFSPETIAALRRAGRTGYAAGAGIPKQLTAFSTVFRFLTRTLRALARNRPSRPSVVGDFTPKRRRVLYAALYSPLSTSTEPFARVALTRSLAPRRAQASRPCWPLCAGRVHMPTSCSSCMMRPAPSFSANLIQNAPARPWSGTNAALPGIPVTGYDQAGHHDGSC